MDIEHKAAEPHLHIREIVDYCADGKGRARKITRNYVLLEDYLKLVALLDQINMSACYASEENTDAREEVLLHIGKLARREIPQ